jgi:hypothetical protein
MDRLIARVDAPEEVRAFPLRLRQELRRLHEKYYRLTFYKAGIFGDAVPPIGGASYSGLGDGYGVVLSPRFNHIGICWDTSKDVVTTSDLILIAEYLNELIAILRRYGYSATATDNLRKIHIDETSHVIDEDTGDIFASMTIDFGVPAQFYFYRY